MLEAQVVVLAKAPVAGRVKTRLCPPLSQEQAAEVAAAALADTMAAVRQVPVRRRLLVLDGDSAIVPAEGFQVLGQRGRGLDERLAAAVADVVAVAALPVLLIGMDTPQVTGPLLHGCLTALLSGSALLGPAQDGGWWAIGLHESDPQVFLGVPMSRDDTGTHQHQRMLGRGLTPKLLPRLRDVDEYDDLLAVAAGMPPSSRLAGVVRDLHARPTLAAGSGR